MESPYATAVAVAPSTRHREITLPASDDAAPSSGWVAEHFPLAALRSASYRALVSAGSSRMRDVSCTLVGTARNIADCLPATIERVERLGRRFGDYRVFVFENDSTDETPEILRLWAEVNPRITVRCEVLGDPPHPPLRCVSRAAAMAAYRTRCQQHVRTHHPDSDYVGVVDLDLVGGWWEEGVAHTFGSEGWDFVGSYGVITQRHRLSPHVQLHYDAWAYRRQGSYEPLSGREGNALAWRRGDALQPTYSCFGGLGFYRTEAYLAAEYGGQDCEHVVLHRGMRERGFGRQFLNPNQLTFYGRKPKRWDTVVIAFDRVRRGLADLFSAEFAADAA